MEERLCFVARLLEGEEMSFLCREFGISRVTGHKIISRYEKHGLDAFKELSRRPYRQANKLSRPCGRPGGGRHGCRATR